MYGKRTNKNGRIEFHFSEMGNSKEPTQQS
jgi:hypothetical protein